VESGVTFRDSNFYGWRATAEPIGGQRDRTTLDQEATTSGSLASSTVQRRVVTRTQHAHRQETARPATAASPYGPRLLFSRD
jgi:hypothetical protein